ncbi:MAG TPA: hypothetical protein PKW08_03285 [Flavobacteriaceae bacterium]|nr:hypothetical protein [Flavobacteriaceae bacterium]MCB9212899.1 hypothetical protein [Alteromonas sp.]HPF11429.1 hypothetical protein [Flavobacteriaceae bacterium]HQU20592.1 hypothetical protein [Flavobacteriaceae bacterium]HQU65085.1 hypothetical protein [Flavobacteriaceae bacterium]
MSKILIALAFFLSLTTIGFSQGEVLNDYSFIVVSKRYNFQFQEDQYQLNSLLKFLFNKNGFHAFFENELPNVSRCDGLWAEVTGDPGFIWTKVIITIKDCYGNELFHSLEGRSKLKDYGKAYTESLRIAFESFEALRIQQKEMRILTDYAANEVAITNPSITDKKEEPENSNVLKLPPGKYTSFKMGAHAYLLQKTQEGYSMYEETTQTDDGLMYVGKLFVVDEVIYYEDGSHKRFIASFSNSGDLSIQKEVEEYYVKVH